MTARAAHATRPAQKAQRELEDLQLALKARNGDFEALDQLIKRYVGFVRMKASSLYFIAGGDSDDLLQEGLIGLYKAVRDYRREKEASFRIVRRAVHHAADHHGDQDRHAQQARAAQPVRLVQPHTGWPRRGRSTARSATALPGSEVEDPSRRRSPSEELGRVVGRSHDHAD